MRDKLHAYLLDRPSGATAEELLDVLFTQPGSDPEFAPRFLHSFLSTDDRFAFRTEDRRWISTAQAALARNLSETRFVVVDLETTGGSAARGDAIIEIGAVRVAQGRLLDRFQTFVDPGRRLPPFITRLTGITDEMLNGQLLAAPAMQRFLEFAADDVLVAHNAKFDMSFLHAAARAHLGKSMTAPHLCTLRLARRLVPEIRRRSLDSLAGHLGILISDRHRALGDAAATAEVLLHLLDRMKQRGVLRLDQALDLQEGAADGRRFVCHLPRQRVERLPEAPGTYRFFDDNGRLLYIGKAKNLRQRVASYLSNAAAHRPKTLDLIRHIHDVAALEAESELEAALHEADEIRRHKPPYNKLSKHLPRIAFVKLSERDRFPRLSIVSRVSTRSGRYFGPFRSRTSAERTVDLLARVFQVRTCTGQLLPSADFSPCLQGQIGACSKPCTTATDAEEYGRQVAALISFFDAGDASVRNEIEAKREAHSRAQRFEAALRAQRDLEMMDKIRQRQKRLAWVVAQQHFLVLQPGRTATSILFYAVLHGRLVTRGVLFGPSDLRPLARSLSEYLASPLPPKIEPENVDGTTILAAWLRDRGEKDGHVLPIDHTETLERQLPEWEAAVNDLSGLAAR